MDQNSDRDDGGQQSPAGPPPESAMGGGSDFGASGGHQASSRVLAEERRPAEPENVPGDAAIERRRGTDVAYRGPERRIGSR
ncbi:MAG: hypothetical protein H0T90_05640 [Gemmatimonadales bacterium]|nr:hypothetical protein [Gemmatimonadales bacterium]